METKVDNVQEYIDSISPIYVLLRCDYNNAGELKIHGMTESSFSLGFSETLVNKFWTGTGYSVLGKTEVDGERWAKENHKNGTHMFQLNTPECPIEVSEQAFKHSRDSTYKFANRNLSFTVKEGAYKWPSVQAMMMEGRVRHFRKKIADADRERAEEIRILDERHALATMEARHAISGFTKTHERIALNLCKGRDKHYRVMVSGITYQPEPEYSVNADGVVLTWPRTNTSPVTIRWEDIFTVMQARREIARVKREQRAAQKL